MKYKKHEENEEVRLDESMISQFRRYLSEIGRNRPMTAPSLPTWWDK